MIEKNEKIRLESIIREINQSWLNNNLTNLENYFHNDMIISDSNFNNLARNRKECIASYESFVKQAKIISYSEDKIDIQITGNTAIVNYIFDITWEVQNKISSEKGRDVFVFEYSNENWLAVWRTILPIL